ncbi:MAG: penicillin-binding protein 2, partial [Actinomycetales bacterium]
IVVPPQLQREDKPINDWFPHDTIHLTLTGVLAKSSNIGTVRATDKISANGLYDYLRLFGLGERTDIGVRGETQGILPAKGAWTSQMKDRIAFGQTLAVNGVQMAAAINTIANGGVRVSPSLIQGSATTEDGQVVGTDTTTERRVVSEEAARQTALMMERVLDPEDGVAPGAAVPGYRVAGKTGTAQATGEECGCYDGTFDVSFGGFAPADDPRFTVYVVVKNPADGGGGSVAGPAFAKVMSYALKRYAVPPTGTRPSRLPVEW